MDSSLAKVKNINLNKLFRFELKFYKALALMSKYTKVYLNIPEMIINGFGFKSPTLICTDYRTGEVIVKENLTNQAISESFAFFSSENSQNSRIPIAVCKKLHNSFFKDKTTLLFSSFECDNTWNYNFTQGKPQVIQKFIKSSFLTIIKSEYLMNSKIKTYSLYKKPEKQTNKSAVFRKNVEQLKFLIKNSDICVKRLVSASTIDNKMMLGC